MQFDTVAFDKTGTLTEGRPTVVELIAYDQDRDELLRLAAAVQAGSQHPLAHAVLDAAAKQNLAIPRASNAQALAGPRGRCGCRGARPTRPTQPAAWQPALDARARRRCRAARQASAGARGRGPNRVLARSSCARAETARRDRVRRLSQAECLNRHQTTACREHQDSHANRRQQGQRASNRNGARHRRLCVRSAARGQSGCADAPQGGRSQGCYGG